MKISDIAENIGVSTATISRVLNDKPNVSKETREKVKEAIKEFNYEYTPRRKSTGICNDDSVIIIAGEIINPVTLEYIEGIRKILTPKMIRTLIVLTDYKSEQEISHINFAKNNSIGGLFLINAIESQKLVETINSMDSPIVLVNRDLPLLDCDLVKIDNYRCGYMATRYLIDRGHKRIAHLAGPRDSVTCMDRTRGFHDAMRDSGLQILEDSIYFSDRNYFDGGKQFGKRIGKMSEEKRFTAVFSTTVLMANGLMTGFSTNNIQVPENISVISSDDSEKFFHNETIFTTVGQSPFDLGVAAAELFLERQENLKGTPKHIVYSPKIIERGSVQQLA